MKRSFWKHAIRVALVGPKLPSLAGGPPDELTKVNPIDIESKLTLRELRDVERAVEQDAQPDAGCADEPDARMISRSSRCDAFTSPSMPLSNTSEKPSTALSGVLNSWRRARR